MTTNNIPPRWYMVSKTGLATLCADEVDARENAAVADMNWRGEAPHVAVQLAPLQSQEREDAERYRALVASGKFVPATLSPSCLWGLRASGTKATKAELDEAIDHAHRVEGKP